MLAVAEFKALIFISAILRNSSSVNLGLKFFHYQVFLDGIYTLSRHDVCPLPGLGSLAAGSVQPLSLDPTKNVLITLYEMCNIQTFGVFLLELRGQGPNIFLVRLVEFIGL